jgi:hypothetical protein
MPISVACPCGAKLRAPGAAFGKTFKGPRCGQPVPVPASAGVRAVPVREPAPAREARWQEAAQPQRRSLTGLSSRRSAILEKNAQGVAETRPDYRLSRREFALVFRPVAVAGCRRTSLPSRPVQAPVFFVTRGGPPLGRVTPQPWRTLDAT